MKKLSIIILSLFLASISGAQTFIATSVPFMGGQSPKREVRAVWLTTIGGLDWPKQYAQNTVSSINRQKSELVSILDKLQAAGINTVLLQTRIRATTIYPSKYEPWDGCLSGQPGISPGYDALQFAIEECHSRGMELHAWVVTIPVGKWNGVGCTALRKKYPTLVKKIDEEGFMNPEDSRTGRYIADICEEITRNYDIDGIHLDYIRYPETWKSKVQGDKGRRHITDIVRQINVKVKALKPWVKMSCSPIGKHDNLPRMHSKGWNAYSRVMQEAQNWLKNGLMDALFPMMYFRDNNFYPFALDWIENSYGRMVVPGLGIYLMSPRESDWELNVITQEMEVLRQWGMGHAYFRSQFFTDNQKGIYDFAKQFDNCSALVPAMTWESASSPVAPKKIEIDSTRNTLSWSGAVDRSNGSYLTYNIYSSANFPVDITNPRNLMAFRQRKTAIRVPLTGRYYAVTAMDRYGNESAAIQGPVPTAPSKIKPVVEKASGLPFFKCDGTNVFIGNTLLDNRALLQIETMQGVAVKTMFAAHNLNVRDLPAGMYQIRSLGRKNARHRLGYFKK